MKLNCNIPQLLPIDGRQIKIYYLNIIKLCTSCFAPHNRRDCKQSKVKWTDYVASFIDSNPQINPNLYGRWASIIEREAKQKQINETHYMSKQTNRVSEEPNHQLFINNIEKEKDQTDDIAAPIQRDLQTGSQQDKPKPEDFNLPSSQEEWKELVDKMVALGLSSKEANASLEKRRKLFNKALKEHSNSATTAIKKGRPKSRKNSLNGL
jgi:hypothetical protein